MSSEVDCIRCGETNPGVEERISFRDSMREEVRDSVCQTCWEEWKEMQVKVINEFALNLGDSRSHQIIEDHAREFFGLPEPE